MRALLPQASRGCPATTPRPTGGAGGGAHVPGRSTHLGDLGGTKGLVQQGVAALGAQGHLWAGEGRSGNTSACVSHVPRTVTRTWTASASLSTPFSISARACEVGGRAVWWVTGGASAGAPAHLRSELDVLAGGKAAGGHGAGHVGRGGDGTRVHGEHGGKETGYNTNSM